MRRLRQGDRPPLRTNIGKALVAFEQGVYNDLGELNIFQQTMLVLLRRHLCFCLMHPGTVGEGEDQREFSDYKYHQNKLEKGMKYLIELGDLNKTSQSVPSIKEIIQVKETDKTA